MRTPLLALMIVFTIDAADMTGVWTFTMNDFSGHPRTFDCTFKQDAAELTGVCGEQGEAVRITGTVKGNKVEFQHQTGRKNDATSATSAAARASASATAEKRKRRRRLWTSVRQPGRERGRGREHERSLAEHWELFGTFYVSFRRVSGWVPSRIVVRTVPPQ